MKYEVLTTEAEVSALIEWHNVNSEFVVVDLETTGLDSWKDEIVDVQISGKTPDEVAIFPGQWIHCLRRLSSMPVGHNLRFDITFLYRKGVDVTHWQYHDTLLLAHLENENRDSYSLDKLLKEFYGESHKEAFWSKYKTYQEAPENERYEYGARDVLATSRLYGDLQARLGDAGIPDSLSLHTHRLQYSLLRTEILGVRVDERYLVNLGVGLKSKIETLLPQMREMVGMEADLVEMRLWVKELEKRKTDKGKANVQRPQFTFDSQPQLQTLLYDCLAMPVQRNEKTKNVSVDDSSLERIKDRHPVVPLIQEYREANKVYGTYIEGTLERMRDGRIYPEFRVNGTVTGRISHSNPNLGQLPRSGGVRGIYTADSGMVLISADYSQLEVVLEANLTEDPTLTKMCLEGTSKHDVTAKGLNISRNTAKPVNFLLQYRGTHLKLAKVLRIPVEEALDIWTRYWDLYAGCREKQRELDVKVDAGEPIVTAFGRKRRFEKRTRQEWDKDYRMAYNFAIQSTGADLTSKAFYLTSEWLLRRGIGRGLFTVHDELLIEVKADYAQEAEAQMLSFMTQTGDEIGLKIPLKAESSGPMLRWED